MEIGYKFSSGQSAKEILAQESLFVTSPLELNDPYESRFSWTDDHAEAAREDQKFREELFNYCEEAFYYDQDKESFEKVGFKGFPDRPKVEIPAEMHFHISDLHNTRFLDILHARFRVLSFAGKLFEVDKKGILCGVPDSNLMWAHYADSFRGVCIGFDTSSIPKGVNLKNKVEYGEKRVAISPDLYRVYSKEGCAGLLGVEYAKIGGLLLNQKTENDLVNEKLLTLMMTKDERWHYENELRIIYTIDELVSTNKLNELEKFCATCEANNSTDCLSKSYRDSIKFFPKAVKEIVFGPFCTHQIAIDILAIVKEKYPTARLFLADLSPSTYGTRYMEKDADYIEKLLCAQEINRCRRLGHIQDRKPRSGVPTGWSFYSKYNSTIK